MSNDPISAVRENFDPLYLALIAAAMLVLKLFDDLGKRRGWPKSRSLYLAFASCLPLVIIFVAMKQN